MKKQQWEGPVAEEYLLRVDVDAGDFYAACEQVADTSDEMCPTEAVRLFAAVKRQAADDMDELEAAPGVLRRRRWRYATAPHPRVENLIAGHHLRAVKYGVRSTLTTEEWTADERLTLDHIVPMVRGGANTSDNVAACCDACNRSKHAAELFDWMTRVSLDTDAAFGRLNDARIRRRANSRR